MSAWLGGRTPREEASESQWGCLQIWLAPDINELNELPSEGHLHYLRWLEGKGNKGEDILFFCSPFPNALHLCWYHPFYRRLQVFTFYYRIVLLPARVFSGLGLHWGCNIVILLYWGFSFLVFGFLPYLLIIHLIYGSIELT